MPTHYCPLHVAGRLPNAQASSSSLGKETLVASFPVAARWSNEVYIIVVS